tara:strand:- start:441 stop:734 length:294 start_codon:yes stop_codon:yes gene_type:complete
MKKNILFLSIILVPFFSLADCVYDAKEKTTFQVLSTGYGGKILFSGGYGSDFIVSVDGYITKYIDSVLILKDDFCSWEDSVLYIDDEVFDVKSVEKI